MNALKYLFFTKIKNTIKDLENHPAKLVLVIIFIGLMALVIFSSNVEHLDLNKLRDINELYAIIFALYSFTFILNAMTGFTSGASFYSMADINILFMSPISSKKILIYGLIRQMGTSLWIGFFIFYQWFLLSLK